MEAADAVICVAMSALVLLSGAISGSETAFFSLTQAQVAELRAREDRLSRLVAHLLERPPRLLLVILLLNNAVNIGYFALASWWGARVYERDPGIAGLIAVASLAALILFGEIFPKVLASGSPARFARLLAPFLWFAATVSSPICRIIEHVLGRVIEEDTPSAAGHPVTGDELKLVIEHTRDHGVVSELVHDRLIEVVDLSSTPAGSVMTHRIDCPSITVAASEDDAIEAMRRKPGPYILVYDEQEDCVGMLAAQDLLRGGKPSRRMRKPLYIPANAQLAQVLELFRDTNRTAGVVVDEYGGTLGLLTLAHVANELLGPGASLDLPDLPEPTQIDENRWRIPGQMPLEEWLPLLEPDDSAGCTTIGGFIAKMLGAVPQVGDQLLYNNLLFRVEEVEGRRIRFMTVEKLPELAARRMTQGAA